MRFKIPKQPGLSRMTSIKNDEIMPILFDDTDLDRMFTVLFERCVKQGETGLPRSKRDFAEDGDLNLEKRIIPALAKNVNLVGFDSQFGREVLLNWVKTSTMEFTTEGKTKRGEQVDYMKFLSLAMYRSGLPKSENRSSTRGIDLTAYRAILSYVGSLPGCEKPGREIHASVTATSLGTGIDFAPIHYPWASPVYNETDPVDINALLQLRLLENFEAKVSRTRKSVQADLENAVQVLDIPFSNVLDELARDFYNMTKAFGSKSGVELLSMYKSIFTLRLYRLPIILSQQLKYAKEYHGELDIQHEMFFDFTRSRKSASFRLANESVLADINQASELISNLIYFREAFDMVKKTKARLDEYNLLSPNEKVIYLSHYAKSDSASDKAYALIEEMETYFSEKGAEGIESLGVIQDTKVDSNFDWLITLILSDVEERGLKSLKKWFYSVGGLKEPMAANSVAILGGDKKSMKSWHYAMSDSVLNTLLHLCFVRDNGSVIQRKEIELSVVIEDFRKRFGILIDVPPRGSESPEDMQAATENLAAFKARIKQLGWFEGLSDDFDAQYISKPAGDR
jgi:hypothetical protein